jgi:hypothetical protein
MATQTQKDNIISEGRQLVKALITLMGDLKGYDQRYVGGGYSSLVNGDFQGANAGILAADFSTAVSNIETILSTYNAGQGTNMEKVTI